jgi:hypothetical protein
MMLSRFPDLALVGEPLAWHPNPIFRGLQRLSVTL